MYVETLRIVTVHESVSISGFYSQSLSDNSLVNFDMLIQNTVQGPVYDLELGKVGNSLVILCKVCMYFICGCKAPLMPDQV